MDIPEEPSLPYTPANPYVKRAATETTTGGPDPSGARILNFLQYGADHYSADRLAAFDLLSVFPEATTFATAVELFRLAAAAYMAGNLGIRQFIDLGCGLPRNNGAKQEDAPREASREAGTPCSTVYVDNDPMVLGQARIPFDVSDYTVVVDADPVDPLVLGNESIRRRIDFYQPVGVLLIGRLARLDDAQGAAFLATLTASLPPGNCVAICVPVSDDPGVRSGVSEVMTIALPYSWRVRDAHTAGALLRQAGAVVEPPGCGEVGFWSPVDPTRPLRFIPYGGFYAVRSPPLPTPPDTAGTDCTAHARDR